MMNKIKKLSAAVIYSNLFIGACAVALALTNQLTVEGSAYADVSLGFIFFSTVFTYSFLKFRSTGSSMANTSHHTWADENPQPARNILVVTAIASLCFFLMLQKQVMLIVLALAAFTALYGMVDIPFLQPKKKLRDFGLLKTIFVAIVWSVITVVVPLYNLLVETDMMVFLVVRRFLFILALTMVFEIKDLKSDEDSQLQTLPMLLGISGTKLLAQGILLLLIIITGIQFFFFELPFANMLAINLSLLVSIFCIQPVDEETNDLWYYVVLDGMMILQFVFVWLTKFVV